jgi:Tol biopolymer transport system component
MKRANSSVLSGALLVLLSPSLPLVCGACGSDEASAPSATKPASSPEADPAPKRAEQLRARLTPGQDPVLARDVLEKIAFLAVENAADETQEIVAFDAEGMRLGALTDDKRIKLELDFCPATRRVAYVSRYEKDPDRFDIITMDLDGGNGVNVTLEFPTPEAGLAVLKGGVGKRMLPNRCPSFSRSGDKIYFAHRKDAVWSLHVTSAKAAVVPELLFAGPKDDGGRRRAQLFDHPEVSPDEQMIACVQRRGGDPESIGLLDLSSRGGEPVFRGKIAFAAEDRLEYPRFSPDGKQLLYLRQNLSRGTSEIRVQSVESVLSGEGEGELVFGCPPSAIARWARNGTAIVLGADLGQGEKVYLIDLEAPDRTPHLLGGSKVALRNPVWIER